MAMSSCVNAATKDHKGAGGVEDFVPNSLAWET